MIQEFEGIWKNFETTVFIEPSTAGLFNQYNDNNDYDVQDGNNIRRENLKKYMESFKEVPKVVFIGEAPGYGGCRFSGVPFTSEKQLCGGNFIIAGGRSSNSVKRKEQWTESSAKVFWDELQAYHPKFLVWNCVPFHPYGNKFLSNRTPKNEEIKRYGTVLSDILAHIKPKKIIALGRKAQTSLKKLGITSGVEYVRHPGRGGAGKFRKQIRNGVLEWFR